MARSTDDRVETGREGRAPAAHSIVEERLFLLTVRCGCGGGPLQKVSQTLARSGERTIDLVRARCPRCEREREYRFDVTSFFGRFYPRRGVSDTPEPSQLLDSVAWVRWARLYLKAFEGDRAGLSGDDRADCGVLALRCLDEALKLFPGNAAEIDEASLHTQGSREALRAGAERFNRYELMGLQLMISMTLASSGIDPDGGDPGVTHHGVVRLVEAVKRAGAAGPPPDDDGPPPPLPAPPAMRALPAKAAPLLLMGPSSPAPEPRAPAGTSGSGLIATALAIAAIAAAAIAFGLVLVR